MQPADDRRAGGGSGLGPRPSSLLRPRPRPRPQACASPSQPSPPNLALRRSCTGLSGRLGLFQSPPTSDFIGCFAVPTPPPRSTDFRGPRACAVVSAAPAARRGESWELRYSGLLGDWGRLGAKRAPLRRGEFALLLGSVTGHPPAAGGTAAGEAVAAATVGDRAEVVGVGGQRSCLV